MLKKILLGVGALLALFLVFVATRPPEYRIERSKVIAAPPEVVFAHLDDLHVFQKWSPWTELDPNQVTTFSGPQRGVGASYTWQGNHKVGKGSMTVTAATPPSSIEYRLAFIEPFASTAKVGYTLVPEGGGTKITWWMEGTNNFVGKMFGVFVNMDEMLGKDFDKGLNKLATLAEAEAKRRAAEALAKQEAERAKAAAEAAAAAAAAAATSGEPAAPPL